MMRVVFMGTPEFAVPSLRALAEDHQVVRVLTRPDAISGRGSSVRPSAVKTAALELGLPVDKPATLLDPLPVDAIAADRPDLIAVAAYGLILPASVLDLPSVECLNVHGSLLPRWRGAAPVQRAILAGDETTGVAIMRMEVWLDTGPYCVTRQTPVDDKTAEDLTSELALLGADALLEAIEQLEAGTCSWTVQDEAHATYAAKIAKSDVALLPGLTTRDALRRVRAATAQAPARLCVGGRCATVLELVRSDATLAPGAVSAARRSLSLGFSDGALEVLLVKPDGRGPMSGVDWARGARFDEDTTWDGAS
jgi:methionyl-tRNA formyltransferase